MNIESTEAFDLALLTGHLSHTREAENYVGFYMFMGADNNILRFKHSVTREYKNLENYSALMMAKAIANHSDNDLCKHICKEVIEGKTTIKNELTRNYGSFITAVLSGDFSKALRLADYGNFKALQTLFC